MEKEEKKAMPNTDLYISEGKATLRGRKSTLAIGAVIAIVALLVVGVDYYKLNKSPPTPANSSIYSSMKLNQAGIKVDDIIETRDKTLFGDGNYTCFWHVSRVFIDDNDTEDSLTLDTAAFRTSSDSDRIHHWWQFRNRVVAIYTESNPSLHYEALKRYVKQFR